MKSRLAMMQASLRSLSLNWLHSQLASKALHGFDHERLVLCVDVSMGPEARPRDAQATVRVRSARLCRHTGVLWLSGAGRHGCKT